MIFTALLAGAALIAPRIDDAWELKAPLDAKTKTTYALDIHADVHGSDHHATMKQIMTIGAPDKDKNIAATFEWSDLTLDDQPTPGPSSWNLTLSPRAAVLASNSNEGDDIRRMFAPLTFVYPEKAVAIGDKWTIAVKPAAAKDDQTVTYTFEVKGKENVGEVETFKIASTMSEKQKDGVSSTGTWWLAKTGVVQKFDLAVKRWVVPMSGSDPIDGAITGRLVK